MPNVRTAKSFCSGKMSTTVGWVSVTPYLRVRVSRARRQQIQHAVAVQSGFQRHHVNDEIRVGQGLELRHLLVQGHEVERGDIVAVLLVNLLDELPAFVILPQAQQILRQLLAGR